MPNRRPNFAAIKARNDAIAWKAIHSRPIPKTAHRGLANSGRPENYRELADAIRGGQSLSYAFAHFLDEFYLFRDAKFFAIEPPDYFSPRYQAFFAGVAEFLSHEFDLPVPAWAERPRYFLDEEVDWVDDGTMPEALRERLSTRRDRATPEFRRRNIVYEGRNLIRL